MTTTPTLLTGFAKGAIDSVPEDLVVLRDDEVAKLVSIDSKSKYYMVWVAQEVEEDETVFNVYLNVTEDTLRTTPGETEAIPTVFTLAFKNPEKDGVWRVFTEGGRYSVMIGAIWQSA